MTVVDHAIASAPPDAIELRMVRYRISATRGQATSEWLGDALWGGDAGPSDGPRPLRIASIHWMTSHGHTVPIDVPTDVSIDAGDVARLMGVARHRGIPFAVWTESDHRPNGTMQLTERWFTGAALSPTPLPSPVEIETRADGLVVSVDECTQPRRWMLVLYPALILSFAWVFFLFVGGLPEMVREIWRLSMTGKHQRWVGTLDAHELRIEVTRFGACTDDLRIERNGLLALGTLGFTAHTITGAVPLPSEFATTNLTEQRAIRKTIVERINESLGSL